jgi:ligand-binding SRPBCC domain-containing protein
MPVIQIKTRIKAPVSVCFDMARSIDLHMESTRQTGETAIAGKTAGLIEMDESVTWRAKHFCVWQTLTSKITEMVKPEFFADEMVEGAFKSFRHEHYFEDSNGYTLMTDVFVFKSPLGVLGSIANVLFLKQYMCSLLMKRNAVIKEFAERHLNANNPL